MGGFEPSFAEHPLPELIAEGLYVTLNSDDPPMLNTALTDEYFKVVEHFGFNQAAVEKLVLAGVDPSVLPDEEKIAMDKKFRAVFESLTR